MTDSLLDDLFSGCALDAFLEQSHAEQGWPNSEATRRLAYRLYEDALAAKSRNGLPTPARSATMPPCRNGETPGVL